MLPFEVRLDFRLPIYEQIVFAVKRATAAGKLKPGDRIPSVRDLSDALQVNPNTVQRAMTELTRAGLLETHPGQGSFLTTQASASPEVHRAALKPLVEKLVVEAMQTQMKLDELQTLIQQEWHHIQRS
jgi:GntR family transcriptional regulator